MAESGRFEEVGARGGLHLELAGFEGPIDLLLSLARDQKVDLARISVLQLADQYLAFLAQARDLRLEIAADYLVMAAWLAYFKSRLLLPPPEQETVEPSAAEMAEALAFQLRRLQAMQEAAVRLFARPKRGDETFARGAPEGLRVLDRPRWQTSLFELLKAYAALRRRGMHDRLTIAPIELYTVDAALERLRRLLGRMPDWQALEAFLPPGLRGELARRSAVAATLSATLELAKSGRVRLRQDHAFGPVYVRAGPGDGRP